MMLIHLISEKAHYWRRGVLGLPFLVCSLVVNLQAQNNLSGQSGLMNVPTAIMSPEGTFKFGYNHNPNHFDLRSKFGVSEQVLYFNLALFPRLELNVNFLQFAFDVSKKPAKEGLGDRQLEVKYLIMKEGKYKPAMAVIMTTPFTIDAAMLTHVLVATKNVALNNEYNLETTLGYGSPYFVFRDVKNIDNADIFTGFKWQKKSEYVYNNGYLVGVFAGVKLSYQKKIGLMAEWDSNRMNIGVYATIAKRLTLQAGLLRGDQVMFGGAYACPLFGTPKALK